MTPTIHLFRCAEAVRGPHHKAPAPIRELIDPELTAQGQQQSAALAAELAAFGGGIELVFTSPMQRAIQTALTVFETYTRSKRIVLLPDLKEPKGTSSSPDDLLRKFGDQRLDFSFMTPGWENDPRYDHEFAAPRGRSTRLFLRAVAQRYRDTDAHIVVVTHGSYIGYLTNPPPAEEYKNAEYRSYRFEQIAGDIDRLIETPCSIARRQKAKSAPNPGPPSSFGLDLPTFGLHTNTPGTHPTTPSCGGTTPPSCGGPASTSCGGQQVSSTMDAPALTASKDANGLNPTVDEKGGMKPLTKMSAPNPTVSNSNFGTTNSMNPYTPQTTFSGLNFNNIAPMNPVSPGNSMASFSNLSKKRTTGTPLFNPYDKKQKTTEQFSSFDSPGKATTEQLLYNWPGKNDNEKQATSSYTGLFDTLGKTSEKSTAFPPLFKWQDKNNSNKTIGNPFTNQPPTPGRGENGPK
ncbi:histidine phosphatase superfamily [Xylaria curta]|nr:histidine phosphatase superfamily [Xylaria curta]